MDSAPGTKDATNTVSSQKRKLEDETESINDRSNRSAKEERREAKRLRKLERAQINDAEDFQRGLADEETRIEPKDISKAAKKAEKARLKAQRKTKRANGIEGGEPLNHQKSRAAEVRQNLESDIDKRATKAARKA